MFRPSSFDVTFGPPPATGEACAHCGAPLAPGDPVPAFAWVRCSACRTVYDRPPFPQPFAPVPRPGDRCEPLTHTLAAHGDTRVLVPRRQAAGWAIVLALVLLVLPLGCSAAFFGWGFASAGARNPAAGRAAAGFLIAVGAVAALVVGLGVAAYRARRRVRFGPGVVTVERLPGFGASAAPAGAPDRAFVASDVRALRVREYATRPSSDLRYRRHEVLVASAADAAEVPLVRDLQSGWDALFVAQEAARALGLERAPWGWGRRTPGPA